MSSKETVLERLQRFVKEHPSKKAWVYLNDHADVTDEYTYEELDNASSYLAHHMLFTLKIPKDSCVLLVFPPGIDFTLSLLACFKAQLIAVPVFPPDPRKLQKDMHHFVSIQENCQAKIVLTNSLYNFVKKVEGIKSSIFSSSNNKWPELKWIVIDDQIKKGKKMKNFSLSTAKVADSDKSDNHSVESIAFLQYTSGSTSEPKGVMITHANLAHNASIFTDELQANQTTINLSWLPQYHDMGLIGSYLGVVYCGGTGYYLSPISFLKDPVVWIRAMSKYRATHTQAPNFAYALVTRKFKEALQHQPINEFTSINLSSLRHMINAAEPVDFQAIQAFYQLLTSNTTTKSGKHQLNFHLPNNIIFPTYGLAENTVFVCSGGRQVLTITKESLEHGRIEVTHHDLLVYKENTNDASMNELPHQLQRIIGCGYPKPKEYEMIVVIVQNTRDTPSDVTPNVLVQEELVVGEIWLDSPSKALGYWDKPNQTEEDFHAKLSPQSIDGKMTNSLYIDDQFIEQYQLYNRHYLRTGDLGFIYQNELFICGRIKDLIIIGGSNHYPQDIEKSLENDTELARSLRPGCSAAFAIDPSNRNTEDLVYVAELKDNINTSPESLEQIVRRVREVISAEHGLSLKSICLLKTRSIPKTTSGKIARSWCRKAYMNNTLEIVHRADDNSPTPLIHPSIMTSDESTATADVNNINHQKNDYQLIKQDDEQNTTTNGQTNGQLTTSNDEGQPAAPKLRWMRYSASEVRALDVEQITLDLESALIHLSSTSPVTLTTPVNRQIPVMNLGFDSMTVVQYKGIIEKRFHTDIPDEFVFTNLATLQELAVAVKTGRLTKEQHRQFDQILQQHKSSTGGGNTTAVHAGDSAPCLWCSCTIC